MAQRPACGERTDNGRQGEMEVDQAHPLRLQTTASIHPQRQGQASQPVQAGRDFRGAPGQLTVGPGNRDPIAPQADVDADLFTMEELIAALRKAANNKAAGMDDLPTEAWQWMTEENRLFAGHPEQGPRSRQDPTRLAEGASGGDLQGRGLPHRPQQLSSN